MSELDFSHPIHCDVAIAGAGLSGLVAGAILARRGRRVVVVDRATEVGGRGGATPHRGYWLDGGQRDGVDIGDLQVGWRYGQLAAAAAGVEVPIRVVEPVVRVHQLPDTPGGGEARVARGVWGAKGFVDLAIGGFGCPEDKVGELASILAKLAAATAEERRAAIPVALGGWLAQNVGDEELRRVVLTMVKVIYFDEPSRASVGRLMGFFAKRVDLPPLQTAYPDHPEVGGMQGLMEPFARCIREGGGRILLDLEPALVDFAASGVRGLVARNRSHLALEIRAPNVILAMPVWQALPLLPASRVRPELAELASRLEDEQADAIAWQAGLTRLPRLRSTGEPESHVGWNRVLVGPERRYLGGFHLPSLGSRRAAPEGRHLLHAFVARWLRKDERPEWSAARDAIGRVIEHLHEFYLDLDDCIDWSAHQFIERPACLAWFWAPIVRHDVDVAGWPGLFIAGTTIESEAGPVDISAHAGLAAAGAILGEGLSSWEQA